ncbi:helix-turn-helix transcriptional regulator [Streptomyces sp. NRRL B-3229]|uniref:helix-turn-helix transcriptional regulator n=1 Tax=Streptomyces sp. NRRL B-3229 TaxID=1463836 RepID=UPI0004BFA323|nr:helix-turn-helix transcriptional regulator [Streptomyces sp. NRRL B-3229]
MLVEREEQLGRLRRVQEAALAGRGRTALIEGPSASGRTELLNTFADRAEEAGFRLLHAICSRPERTHAHGVVTQLLRYAGPAGHGTTAHSADDLWAALLDHSAEGPVLIAVDDVQHADEPSLRMLLHLAHRLRSAPMAMVFTDNTDVAPVNLQLRAELVRQAGPDRLKVGPLGEAGVTAFLSPRLGPETARRLTPYFRATTGGIPLLLSSLADDWEASDGDESVGPSYCLAVLSCLHRGDEAALALARALAVLGPDAADDTVAALADVPVEPGVRVLTAAGLLLSDGGFREPGVRQAVLDDLAPRTLAALHRRAAGLLYDGGAPAGQVARHLLAAGRADEPWAVQVLLEAADHELLADRPDAAAVCLELAQRSSGDLTERAEILARLAHTEFLSDPAPAARSLPQLVTADRAGRLRFAESVLLIRQLLWHGRNAEAAEALERLRTAATARGAVSGEQSDLEQWLGWAHPQLARPARTPVPGPRRPGGGSVVTLRSEPWLERAAALAGELARDRQVAVERAEHVLWDLRLSRSAYWSEEAALLALLTLAHGDRTDSAAEWCERLALDAAERATPTWQAVFQAVRATVAVRQGDLAAAFERGRLALELLPAKSWGVAIGLPLSGLIVATTRMGRYDEALRHLSQAVPSAMYESWYGLPFLQARGIHHLATHHHRAALGDFLSCGELQRQWGVQGFGPLPWRAGAAEACIQLGNMDRAKQLVHEQLSRPGASGGRARGIALRLYAATCAPGRGLQLLNEALELLESAGDRFEQARVLGDMSRLYNAVGEQRRARMLFRQSLHVAKACGAQPLAQELLAGSADGEADRVPPPETRGAAGGLTGSETRVASLAVMGYTNREIAAKLYVTPSTVEQHLTRVYRKLRIQRRQDLPSFLWPNASKAG